LVSSDPKNSVKTEKIDIKAVFCLYFPNFSKNG
jgi:hypothetical protein